MDEKLNKLYEECINELKSININIINNPQVGKIDIGISKRNTKRYGCCKQEKPDQNCFHLEKRKHRIVRIYDKFFEHHIEISKWVMELDDDIIKNTIIHEIIHCLPQCNNHKKTFKIYANLINDKLGYNITRLGNKKEDYKKSNIHFEEDTEEYKYKIKCTNCGQVFLRKRLKKDFIKNYRCGKCGRKIKPIKYYFISSNKSL